jgi:hypothetical protein
MKPHQIKDNGIRLAAQIESDMLSDLSLNEVGDDHEDDKCTDPEPFHTFLLFRYLCINSGHPPRIQRLAYLSSI